jgi:hypothetical protein
MPYKDKKQNKKPRKKGGTKVKVKVKTGSSQKSPSLMSQLLSAGVGGLTGLFASRALGPQRPLQQIDPRIMASMKTSDVMKD